MTATTPENGLRPRFRRLARGTVVSAIALALCGLGAGSASAASDSTTDESPATELVLTAGVRGTVTPGSATTASLTVINDDTSALSAGRVTVELNRTPLPDETAVASWLDDSEAAGGFTALGSDATAPVDPESSVTSSLFIPADTLTGLAPGVYPIRATLTGAATDAQEDADAVTSTSVLVVSAAAKPSVAVLVPITATPADGALLTAEELNVLTADDGRLTAVLEGVSGTSAVLAIDPAIPAAINALGSTASESTQEWLRQLEALPNERFALQFGDADATTQAQAGLPALLQPTTLAPFVNPAGFTNPAPETPDPTPTPTDAPQPTPEPTDGPVLPDDSELITVDGATPGLLWPRSDVSAADLATFATYVGDDAVTTVLSSSALSGATGARGAVGAQNVLVVDEPASDALSKAANEPDAAIRQRWLAEASAHLALSAQAHPSVPRLIGLDRDETRTAEALSEAISAVDSLGFGLSGVLAAPAAPVTLSVEPDSTRGTALQRMLDSEVVLGEFASILDDRQLLLSPKRIQIMRATAVGLGEKGFDEAVAAVNTATIDTLNAVDIPPASTIQLLSANADLPFSVRNDLPWPVNIRLSVHPSDPRLDVQAITPWTIQPDSTTRVKVPVSARVGSGEVSLRLELSSPTGVEISQPETVRVSVRAEWETIGLALLGTLIVLLIGLGIIRTVRRRRREAAETADTDQSKDRDADADAGAESVAIEESNE
ncbi:DUF6049 family protein [Microbacterium hydrocarbonoxydans]|uniref:2-oxoglutarate dehydrogenase n=1 Tax=Microbacterium hydrocarbonoxydans TaxID=273678 RepID=A0A1H4IXE5_9MICO|nr:DUF6049 family protein [Microbacterium hydrocarbonoxydans]SEB38505.1 hypothetical protein SAMN04489807_0368 [Microbacterium hydrocarbonoxydans]